MGFRENLKTEMNYQDMRIKELGFKAGINPRTIEQYLSSAAKMPSAENAVKIASALGVTVEYLITGNKDLTNQQNENSVDYQNQIRLYKKYRDLIEQAEHLNEQQIKAVISLIKTM